MDMIKVGERVSTDVKAALGERLGLSARALEEVGPEVCHAALKRMLEMEARPRELERTADRDELTGVMRRGSGMQAMRQELKRAQRFGQKVIVGFLDVEGLKRVNDTQGHAAGDQLIQNVASMVRAGLRGYDVLARYGGDEFICSLPGTTERAARRRFAAISRSLARVGARITVGVAEVEMGETLESALERADAELYAIRAVARAGQPLDARVI
jgi:diguanylate cyclase (GGDEF)-like protein